MAARSKVGLSGEKFVEPVKKKTRQGAGQHTKYSASSRNKAREALPWSGTMRLSEEEFREHMDSMIASGNLKQARLWAEAGTLIYVNVDELKELYQNEYEEICEG